MSRDYSRSSGIEKYIPIIVLIRIHWILYQGERKNEEQEGIDNSSDNNRFFTLWICDE